jgi:hypothetical protein
VKKKIEADIADSEAKLRANAKFYHGADWWHLSEEEEHVFGIVRDRWPRLMTVWMAYEVVIGLADYGEFNFTDKEVADGRWRCGLSCGHSLKEFGTFGKEYGGLSYREAKAVYEKMQFWNIRNGITSYGDEKAPQT